MDVSKGGKRSGGRGRQGEEWEETDHLVMGWPYVGPRSVLLHSFVVALYSFSLYCSDPSICTSKRIPHIVGGKIPGH